jgi:hypothetical protein
MLIFIVIEQLELTLTHIVRWSENAAGSGGRGWSSPKCIQRLESPSWPCQRARWKWLGIRHQARMRMGEGIGNRDAARGSETGTQLVVDSFVGPDGGILATDLQGEKIKEAVAAALGPRPRPRDDLLARPSGPFSRTCRRRCRCSSRRNCRRSSSCW